LQGLRWFAQCVLFREAHIDLQNSKFDHTLLIIFSELYCKRGEKNFGTPTRVEAIVIKLRDVPAKMQAAIVDKFNKFGIEINIDQFCNIHKILEEHFIKQNEAKKAGQVIDDRTEKITKITAMIEAFSDSKVQQALNMTVKLQQAPENDTNQLVNSDVEMDSEDDKTPQKTKNPPAKKQKVTQSLSDSDDDFAESENEKSPEKNQKTPAKTDVDSDEF
jgi:hypothetical protein